MGRVPPCSTWRAPHARHTLSRCVGSVAELPALIFAADAKEPPGRSEPVERAPPAPPALTIGLTAYGSAPSVMTLGTLALGKSGSPYCFGKREREKKKMSPKRVAKRPASNKSRAAHVENAAQEPRRTKKNGPKSRRPKRPTCSCCSSGWSLGPLCVENRRGKTPGYEMVCRHDASRQKRWMGANSRLTQHALLAQKRLRLRNLRLRRVTCVPYLLHV